MKILILHNFLAEKRLSLKNIIRIYKNDITIQIIYVRFYQRINQV